MTCFPFLSTPVAAVERPVAKPQGPGLWSRLWRSLFQSDREAYLAGATDLVDLERRQRAWERAASDTSLLALVHWR